MGVGTTGVGVGVTGVGATGLGVGATGVGTGAGVTGVGVVPQLNVPDVSSNVVGGLSESINVTV